MCLCYQQINSFHAESCQLPKTEDHLVETVEEFFPEDRFSHNSQIRYKCPEGYKLDGENTLVCESGTWNHPPPSCTIVHCAGLRVAHGSVSLLGHPGWSDFRAGSLVQVDCNPGYKLSGAQTLSCQISSTWNETVPKCVPQNWGGDMDHSCSRPPVIHNTLVYEDGQPLPTSRLSFHEDSQVQYYCVDEPGGEAAQVTRICRRGQWIGGDISCGTPDVDVSQQRTCLFPGSKENTLSFYDGQVLSGQHRISHGGKVSSRCYDLGKYHMNGSSVRWCNDGVLDGEQPHCLLTSMGNSRECLNLPVCLVTNQLCVLLVITPPTILISEGNSAPSDDGKLFVSPGGMLFLDCLFQRRFGFPAWTWTSNGLDYPTGWSYGYDRDPDMEFRLTIPHLRKSDTGTYKCTTPYGYAHHIEIVVRDVQCPKLSIPHSSNRKVEVIGGENRVMNSKVRFRCPPDYNLHGSEEVTCRYTGQWSDRVPICIMECPDLRAKDIYLEVSRTMRNGNSHASFSCLKGYQLVGLTEITCRDGSWSGSMPYCQASCGAPKRPLNGHVRGASYLHGAYVTFECDRNFLLVGAERAKCMRTGNWSQRSPQCRATCAHPGPIFNGRTSSSMRRFKADESLVFECHQGYRLVGVNKVKCLETGHWSYKSPECIPL